MIDEDIIVVTAFPRGNATPQKLNKINILSSRLSFKLFRYPKREERRSDQRRSEYYYHVLLFLRLKRERKRENCPMRFLDVCFCDDETMSKSHKTQREREREREKKRQNKKEKKKARRKRSLVSHKKEERERRARTDN